MPEAEPIKPNVYPDHVFPSLAIVTSEMDQLCHGATALPEGSILNGDMGGQAVLEDTPELSVLDVVAVEKNAKIEAKCKTLAKPFSETMRSSAGNQKNLPI